MHKTRVKLLYNSFQQVGNGLLGRQMEVC